MKTFYKISIDREDNDLWEKREKYLKNIIPKFYNKIKDSPNLVTADYMYSKQNKLFSTSIWSNKGFLDWSSKQANPIVFGLDSGIGFANEKVYIINGKGLMDYEIFFLPSIAHELKFDENFIITKYHKIKSTFKDIEILKAFIDDLNSIAAKFDLDMQKEVTDKKNKVKIEQEQLKVSKRSILQELDKDKNGEIDLIENDFNKLLSKYQKQVIGIDKNYIHQFVKVSNYIKTKKSNIQKIFESIEKTSSKVELDERLNLLKNQIHTYELLVFHSINMISALVSEDLITFYEIYESFDKIGIYNSNWENEVSDKLSTIGNKLNDLLLSIYEMENKIVSEISYLNYVTQESFSELNSSVTSNLKDINSSIDVNNLFTAINTYQLYKINKQTKPLLPKK